MRSENWYKHLKSHLIPYFNIVTAVELLINLYLGNLMCQSGLNEKRSYNRSFLYDNRKISSRFLQNAKLVSLFKIPLP